jgi:hypothetical protein
VQLLLFVLQLIQSEVDSALRKQILVRALLAQTPFVEDQDPVRVLNRAEPMSNHQRGSA